MRVRLVPERFGHPWGDLVEVEEGEGLGHPPRVPPPGDGGRMPARDAAGECRCRGIRVALPRLGIDGRELGTYAVESIPESIPSPNPRVRTFNEE
ncbi:hypothetical protein GCM10010196_25050 [Agromyces mediolanus]|uniref:Uncharacterized protein n=1 Tax=Agromyces mediolanus TaxID=41986 RepID=A0A918FEQ8_AGRME|nr:hypothetical protein GCM10010196_25050 [Agromyces mediolanus]GLJ72302.1 hypothetical protein GCM10017583_15580 [Agromyces mediolanus]